jgi:hypothetical protein
VLSLSLGAASAFGGAGTDKIAFHVRQAAKNGEHQAPGACAGVGPPFRERAELRLGVRNALDDAEQVKGAAGKPVDPRHCNHVAGGKPVEHTEKPAPVGLRARYLLAVDVPADESGGAQLLKLGVECLPGWCSPEHSQ